MRARKPLPPGSRESTRARRDDIVPFIKSDMPVQAKGSIVEIVVGPSAATGAEDGVCVYALLKPFYDGPNAIAVLWKLFCAQITVRVTRRALPSSATCARAFGIPPPLI